VVSVPNASHVPAILFRGRLLQIRLTADLTTNDMRFAVEHVPETAKEPRLSRSR
jgi:hypothetical protein